MEGEISNFIKSWAEILVSTWYCYLVSKVVPKGTSRLIFFLPVIFLFFILPLNMNSFHFGITTSYFIAWLANFKLILFAIGIGPLSDPSLSLGRFVLLTCFPIKIKQIPPPKPPKLLVEPPKNTIISYKSLRKSPNGMNNGRPLTIASRSGLKSPLNYATKAFLLVFMVLLNEYYKDHIHANLFQLLMCLYIYMGSEILLATVAIVARFLLRTELEPQFGEPYLCSSLKDFWGHHWNLMSSDILRSTIYQPAFHLSLPVLGRTWAPVPAVLATFLVSGFMHELMFYYVGRLRPSWGTTLFFLLHGLCLIVETGLKKFIGVWRLPRIISGPLIFGFVIITSIWLVLPDLLRLNSDARTMEEYEALGTFVMDLVRAHKFLHSDTARV